MAADALVIQEAKASATMILAKFPHNTANME